MKGLFGIGVAFLGGILIILGALAVQGKTQAEETGVVAVQEPPLRTFFETKDSNGDGVEDWEESLEARVFDVLEAPSSTLSLELDKPYTPPTTFTGKFSEAFLQDYLEGKVNGQDFSDPTAFVKTAVAAIEQNTKVASHTRVELTLVPTTDESVREYGNRLAEIMRIHSIDNEPEAYILQKALETKDAKLLEDLAPIADVYRKTIADSLVMEVPDEFADVHVDYLNANEAILLDIEAMQLAFVDPLYSLARVKNYQADARALFDALSFVREQVTARGISYGNDESGAILYLFEKV